MRSWQSRSPAVSRKAFHRAALTPSSVGWQPLTLQKHCCWTQYRKQKSKSKEYQKSSQFGCQACTQIPHKIRTGLRRFECYWLRWWCDYSPTPALLHVDFCAACGHMSVVQWLQIRVGIGNSGVCIRRYRRTYIHTYLHTYFYVYLLTYLHTYKPTHAHTHMGGCQN